MIRLSGMTGTFNATVQSQIDGQSTAPIGGTAASSASAAPAATTPVVTTTSGASVTSAAASGAAAKTSAAAGAASTNSANRVAGAGVALFAGIALAVLSGVLC